MRKPTQGELDAIQTELRLIYAQQGKLPGLVRRAGENRVKVEVAWRNEALRFWYLIVRRNLEIKLGEPRLTLVDEDGEEFTQPLIDDVKDTLH